jgi:hypothetical protein
MKLMEILEEGISDIVYHATDIIKAANILQKDQFHLQAAFAKDSENKSEKPYYFLSTTRSRTGEYHTGGSQKYIQDGTVLFKLDGRKLGQKYKAKPIDYWGANFKTDYGKSFKDEMEDRVLSNTNTIPATPYIQAMDIFIKSTPNAYSSNKEVSTDEHLLYLYNLAKHNKIPVRFFDTFETFISGRNPIPNMQALKLKHKAKGVVTIDDRKKSRRKSFYGNALDKFIKMAYLAHKNKPLTYYALSTVKGNSRRDDTSLFDYTDFKYKHDRDYIYDSITIELHNQSLSPKMVKVRELMKLFDVNNFKDLFNKVVKKTLELNQD